MLRPENPAVRYLCTGLSTEIVDNFLSRWMLALALAVADHETGHLIEELDNASR